MPHERVRYITPRLHKALSFSPVVGIVGQRQVGKTTLLEANAASYSTFDRERELRLADSDPEVFLSGPKRPFAIDEAQLCPKIFPALKEAVRVNKRPGQFLLSGSVRFTSREAIRESLTGRIVSIELLPFTFSEAHERPMTDYLHAITRVRKAADLSRVFGQATATPTAFESYLKTGGLPGICFFRDESIRAEKFESHLDTLLNRDLRLVSKTNLPYSSLRALLEYVALNQGRPFELKAAGDTSRISTVTLKRILQAFEALFLIRGVSAEGEGAERRPTYFFEDQGMATWLMRGVPGDAYDITRGLYANLRQEILYHPERNGRISQFRTKNGVNVPLVFSSTEGTVGIIPTIDAIPAPKTLGSAQAFLKKWPRAMAIIATSGKQVEMKGDRLFFVPYHHLI